MPLKKKTEAKKNRRNRIIQNIYIRKNIKEKKKQIRMDLELIVAIHSIIDTDMFLS